MLVIVFLINGWVARRKERWICIIWLFIVLLIEMIMGLETLNQNASENMTYVARTRAITWYIHATFQINVEHVMSCHVLIFLARYCWLWAQNSYGYFSPQKPLTTKDYTYIVDVTLLHLTTWTNFPYYVLGSTYYIYIWAYTTINSQH